MSFSSLIHCCFWCIFGTVMVLVLYCGPMKICTRTQNKYCYPATKVTSHMPHIWWISSAYAKTRVSYSSLWMIYGSNQTNIKLVFRNKENHATCPRYGQYHRNVSTSGIRHIPTLLGKHKLPWFICIRHIPTLLGKHKLPWFICIRHCPHYLVNTSFRGLFVLDTVHITW